MKFASFAFAALLSSAPALAQQSSPAASWSGFRIGGHIGSTWANNKSIDLVIKSSTHNTGQGFKLGAQLGYDHQFGQYVFGGLVDFSGIPSFGRALCPNLTSQCGHESRWLATLRARAGVEFNNSLFYLSGGVARGSLRQFIRNAAGTGPGYDASRYGWVMGLGAEYALTSNWSIGAEFLHVRFGSATAPAGILAPNPIDITDRENIIRIGASYRFAFP